jgi:hypothetical protein
LGVASGGIHRRTALEEIAATSTGMTKLEAACVNLSDAWSELTNLSRQRSRSTPGTRAVIMISERHGGDRAMSNTERTTMRLAALLVLAGCAAPANRPVVPSSDPYQASIAAAAVKRPDYVRALQPIDTSLPKVTVVHFQDYPTVDTKYFTWVTLPDALHAFCHGKPDPVLAIQQALGLPPEQRTDWRVFTFDVRPADMFRPCASSPDITTKQCAVDLPERPIPAQAATEHFVLKQMLDSYRIGFTNHGYPFTGMGWSYDWDPDSPTHQGVSEYVVKQGAVIFNVTSADPATFCGK